MSTTDYPVQEGDCISSIAQRYGFFWQTLWTANGELKSLRKNPNVLFPGDVVKVPDRAVKYESRSTEKLHTFVKKGVPAKFRLVVEHFNVPLANRRYLLTIDGKTHEGKTDSTGLLEAFIDPAASQGHLSMPDDQLECDLELGHLDPATEITGIQQRLQNLGFLTSEVSGEVDEETTAGIAAFQASMNLPSTGELNDETRQKLIHMQDEVHPQRHEESSPADEADSSPDEFEEITPDIDEEEDAAEMARFTSLD